MISARSGASPVLPATISTSPASRSICMPPCGFDSRHRSPGWFRDDRGADHSARDGADVELDATAGSGGMAGLR